MTRQEELREAFDLVRHTMRLRPPQADALEEVVNALLRLPARLRDCTSEQRQQFLTFGEFRHSDHPAFTLALATGLGKSRLAGALMATLWLSNEADLFLLLAPRRAVLRRLAEAFDPRFHDYIFVDESLVPEPVVIQADQMSSPIAVDIEGQLFDRGPRIFLLSQQFITSSPAFRQRQEIAQRSPADVLRERSDLVVIVDEAHHVGKMAEKETSAWAGSIRDLLPALQVGLTATPREEAGVNLLFDYPLRQALSEGLYTKAVVLQVREFEDADSDPWRVDQQTIMFALERLALKEQAISGCAVAPFPRVKPTAVFFAKDIEHAQKVYRWLLENTNLRPEELLLTYSTKAKTDDDLERLLGIESFGNPVRVVVNVMELTEGWDVNNVYVVAPLRAMATFQGALQAMGRGLRLPAGKRTATREVDTLDVVCFGKDSLENIVREATEFTGRPIGPGDSFRVKRFDARQTLDVPVSVPVQRSETVEYHDLRLLHEELAVSVDPAALSRIRDVIVKGIEVGPRRIDIKGVDGKPRLRREVFLDAAASKVVGALPEYLSDAKHLDRVRETVAGWLDTTGPREDWVSFDPVEVASALTAVLQKDAMKQAVSYIDDGLRRRIDFPGFPLSVPVEPGPDGSPPAPSLDLIASLPLPDALRPGMPCQGFQRSLHPAYTFDSIPEYRVALALDRSSQIDWWVRNQPRRLRIVTPAGQFFPDFIVTPLHTGQDPPVVWLLEVKGDLYWEPSDSPARVKSEAAKEWCRLQPETLPLRWRHGVILESATESCANWEDLLRRMEGSRSTPT